MRNENTQNTQGARVSANDPTNEQRGYIRTKPATRGLLVKNDSYSAPFFRGATARRCKALTPCIVTLADGTSYEFKKAKTSKEVYLAPLAKSVRIRHRTLYADISRTLDVAERCGYNLDNVANQYRTRRDNGYHYDKTITTNETYSFRGTEV